MSVRLLLVVFLSSCGWIPELSLQHEARAGVFLVAQFHLVVVGIVSVAFVSNCTLHMQLLWARSICERHCAHSKSLTPIFYIGIETSERFCESVPRHGFRCKISRKNFYEADESILF